MNFQERMNGILYSSEILFSPREQKYSYFRHNVQFSFYYIPIHLIWAFDVSGEAMIELEYHFEN